MDLAIDLKVREGTVDFGVVVASGFILEGDGSALGDVAFTPMTDGLERVIVGVGPNLLVGLVERGLVEVGLVSVPIITSCSRLDFVRPEPDKCLEEMRLDLSRLSLSVAAAFFSGWPS